LPQGRKASRLTLEWSAGGQRERYILRSETPPEKGSGGTVTLRYLNANSKGGKVECDLGRNKELIQE